MTTETETALTPERVEALAKSLEGYRNVSITPAGKRGAAAALRSQAATIAELRRQVERHESGAAYRGRVEAAEQARASLLHADMKNRTLRATLEQRDAALWEIASMSMEGPVEWGDPRDWHRHQLAQAIGRALRALTAPEATGGET